MLLVVLSALGGVLLFTSNDDRTEVLVAATALEPGQPLERSDLRIQRVALDGGVASIDPADAPELVGRITVGQVPAGTMLAPGMFADDAALGPDEMVVGAALDPGEAPLSAMQIGSPVELLVLDVPDPGQPTATTPTDPATGAAAPVTGPTATSIGTGTVWAVEPIATGQLWVSMRVSRQVGLDGLVGLGAGRAAGGARRSGRMTLLVVASVAGSPGATRFALGLAASWPEPRSRVASSSRPIPTVDGSAPSSARASSPA